MRDVMESDGCEGDVWTGKVQVLQERSVCRTRKDFEGSWCRRKKIKEVQD